ncbi:MAG: hypothetical protein V7K50_28660 [Nostoc sp.]
MENRFFTVKMKAIAHYSESSDRLSWVILITTGIELNLVAG